MSEKEGGPHFPLNWKVLTTIVASAVGIIGATYKTISTIYIAPLRTKNTALEKELHAAKTEVLKHNTRADKYEAVADTLKEESNLPILLSPAYNGIVLGRQIRFEWDYKKHDSRGQRYTLELINFNPSRSERNIFDVATPLRKLMHTDDVTGLSGRNIWRVRPGTKAESDQYSHLWSRYGYSCLYSSALEKIKQSKILAVGITPVSLREFNFKNENGTYAGFDIDLVEWITGKLAERLGIEISARYKDSPWENIFKSVQIHDVDIAIGSITSTAERERLHPGIKFTTGYITVSQIFIQKKKSNSFPRDLVGATVGVAKGTTNQRVGEYLADKFNFRVNDAYTHYADIYEGLDLCEIDFALVDNLLVASFLDDRFEQFGPVLDSYLQNFYREGFRSFK